MLPIYGNKDIKTPNIDFLAENGVVFKNAISNAPYCSPARSTLISGNYATTYGTDWHRNQMVVPKEYFFPQYLKDAGYFTVNAGKTDYNVTQDLQKEFLDEVWDKRSGYAGKNPNATYNDPSRGNRPFFAQFNNHATHMSRITSVTTEVRAPLKLDSAKIDLPPHVPDLPEVRADYALHLEGVQDIDEWVGIFINDLKNRGLLDDTIIFFFSDHGGNLPRGKAFPFETGMKAALIIYAPEKWAHLLPAMKGSQTDRIVEFADFGPTLLSIAGAPIPEHMKGQPFMGEFEAGERSYGFGFRTNSEDHFDPVRTVFNKRFHYIRSYTPYKKTALKQSFQWGMPAQVAWDKHYLSGKADIEHQSYYEVKPKEMLFDMIEDPYALNNLAEEPAFKSELEKMRLQGEKHIRSTYDLGFFPRDIRDEFTVENISLYEWIHTTDYDFESFYNLVELASDPSTEHQKLFKAYLTHERPEFRFWAYSGLTFLAKKGKFKDYSSIKEQLRNEAYFSVLAIGAEGMVYSGDPEGYDILISSCKNNNTFALSSLENIGSYDESVLLEIESLSKASKNGKIRFGCRSILINEGRLGFDQLFEPKSISDFVKNYFDRVKNWMPSIPSSEVI